MDYADERKTIPSSKPERYQVLQILGEGGMGIVQLVKDRHLQREVALKKIKLPFVSTKNLEKAQKKMLWRFRREASITAILEHPNIIPLHDMQQHPSTSSGTEGEISFTMRKVEGETLTKKLRKKRDHQLLLNEHQILSIYRKVCDAIAYAHDRGVIHRDLKPDNIMIGKFGEVYVMDWGIAKLIGESTEALEQEIDFGNEIGTSEGLKTVGGMGTPGYMPPEQAENARFATARSDIYALGKMLRECYLLRSPLEEIKRIDLSQVEKGIPEDILAIINKATDVEPQHRYESVQKMAEDLDAYLQHRAVSVRKYSFWELTYKWIQRNKQSFFLGSSILGLILLLFIYSLWRKKYELSVESQKFYTQFTKEVKPLESQLIKTREDKSEKMKLLLKGLSFLNRAMQLNPEEIPWKEKKYQLCQDLFTLACENNQYLLAYSVSQEIEKLGRSDAQKFSTAEVKKLQKQTLEEHQKRLDNWIKKLKPKEILEEQTKRDIYGNEFRKIFIELKDRDLENAIYEISRMKEPEIRNKILELFREGTEYFSSSEKRMSQFDEFYINIVEILSHIVTEQNGNDILLAIQKILPRLEKNPRLTSETKYLQRLMKALGNTRASEHSKEMKELALRLGTSFWKSVENDHQKLSSQE